MKIFSFKKQSQNTDTSSEEIQEASNKKTSFWGKINTMFFKIIKLAKYSSLIFISLILFCIYLIFSGNKAQDFGVKVDRESAIAMENKTYSWIISKNEEINNTEITSFFKYNMETPRFSDIQIVFEDNEFQASFVIKKALASFDVGTTIAGNITSAGDKLVVKINSIVLGRLPIPFGYFKDKIGNSMTDGLNEFLKEKDIDVKNVNIEIEENKLILKGK